MTPEIKQKIEDKAKELYLFSQNASGYDVNNDARHSFIKGAQLKDMEQQQDQLKKDISNLKSQKRKLL